MEEVDEVLQAIQQKRSLLEKDVETKRAALEEAETRLSAFRANALSALGAASGSKSAQKQRSERQAVVAQTMHVVMWNYTKLRDYLGEKAGIPQSPEKP